MDDSSPETAQVIATIDGAEIRIDFLGHVLGVRRDIENHVAEIVVMANRDNGTEFEVAIPLMHPLDCLRSRVANIVQLNRIDDVAQRQAAASPVVLREYLLEALADSDHREVSRTLGALFHYLRRDPIGRGAHKAIGRDPIEVIERFATDERLDTRYREYQLVTMIGELRGRRD